MTVEERLETWVGYCRVHGMRKKGLGFLLLLDFIGGHMSAEFYQRHAAEAMAVIKEIDRSKSDAADVAEDMTVIVEKCARKEITNELF